MKVQGYLLWRRKSKCPERINLIGDIRNSAQTVGQIKLYLCRERGVRVIRFMSDTMHYNIFIYIVILRLISTLVVTNEKYFMIYIYISVIFQHIFQNTKMLNNAILITTVIVWHVILWYCWRCLFSSFRANNLHVPLKSISIKFTDN